MSRSRRGWPQQALPRPHLRWRAASGLTSWERETAWQVSSRRRAYLSLSYDNLRGDVAGVSIGGLPIRADAEVEVNLVRLGVTQSFDAGILGGRPALNLTVPILDVDLDFIAVSAPIAGAEVNDTTSGAGDIIVTPILGWSRGMLHYSASLSIYAPTGDYETATIDVADRSVDPRSNGKNVWSFQPVSLPKTQSMNCLLFNSPKNGPRKASDISVDASITLAT